MNLRFIEVHDAATGGEESVHVAAIEGFFTEMVTEGVFVTHIDMVDGDCYQVQETYEKIKFLIEDCGCLIHKDDPRLDTTHPLTTKDLMTMVSPEPVWNSNACEWGLVTKDPEWNGEKHEGYYLRYHDGSITRFDADDLIKYPLYRMKVNDGDVSK